MFSFVLRLIGVIQIILGVAYLLLPSQLLQQMGHSQPAPDLFYPLGMLAARFVAYGVGLWLVSRQPEQHVLWIRLMALIQFIDFMVGAAYTATGVLPLSLSAFPMFNALWIGLLCFWWKPRSRDMQALGQA